MTKEPTLSSTGGKQENTVTTSLGTSGSGVNGSNLTTGAINTSLGNAGALVSLTTSEVTSESVNATTKARETPSDEGNKALEEQNTKDKVEEGDKSDEEAAKAETLETWSSSSFFSSASPEDLLKQSSTRY